MVPRVVKSIILASLFDRSDAAQRIADHWRGDARNPNEWRDMHFRVEGPVVAQMQAVFNTTGQFSLKSRSTVSPPRPTSCPAPSSPPATAA